MNRQNVVLQKDAPGPLGKYPHAVMAGEFVFFSGQGARDAATNRTAGVTLDEGGQVVSYDIAAQTRAVIENLKTVVTAAGLMLEDLVDVTVFLRDMSDFEAYNRVYGEYFGFENPPARTTIEARPPGHNFIEIKAVGYKPKP